MVGPGSSGVERLELGGWDVAEFAVQAAVVEPFDPAEGGQFDVVGVAPGALSADEFCLVEPVHGFGEAVVIRLSAAKAHPWRSSAISTFPVARIRTSLSKSARR